MLNFLKAFGEEPNPKVISNAIASYERTLISSNSRFDQYNFHGDSLALNASEIRGMKLFYNKLNCSSCHSGFNFSNGEIINTGLYENYNDVGKMSYLRSKVIMANSKYQHYETYQLLILICTTEI